MISRSISMLFASVVLTYSIGANGKGLEDLSGQNPEVKAEDEGAEGAETTTPENAATVVNQEPVSYAGPLHQKLSFSTGFGWVIAKRSKGEWRGNGISDLAVGFRFKDLSPLLSLTGTYRYAPVNVVGEIDGHSYRGVWESHYFGTKADYKLNPKLVLNGGMEVGYVLVYLLPTDGLETEKKHEDNGVSVTLGGGADYMISENWAFAVGPRLYAGFGSFSTIQIGASAGFMF